MEYPIIEWKNIADNQILITVNNTPLLNDLDRLNNRILFIYFNSTDSVYDSIGVVPLRTYEGMDKNKRYFIINNINGIPQNNGSIIIRNDLTLEQQKTDNLSSDPTDNNIIPSNQQKDSENPTNQSVKTKNDKKKRSIIFFFGLIIILLILFFLKIKYF